MISERRRDDLINCTEAFFEGYIEKLVKTDDVIDQIAITYDMDFNSEERELIKELFVSHLIMDVF